MRIGALYQGNDVCLFRVFAPEAKAMEVELEGRNEPPRPMARTALGYWEARVEGVPPGTLYRYRIAGGERRPDPASQYQPKGVEGPSQVWEHGGFKWSDAAWQGHPLEECILYEVHIGTFTPEGTFAAAIPKIGHLQDLGVNAIEIMPVNQFPGDRNWGYDGAYPFAVQNSYGGPDGLKALVDACHAHGISVILDVVYNHLGPEGNYLKEFAPYFTSHYRTPWGSAVNFDRRHSDQVRDFFIENALYWLREFHLDGLRLDAIHQMYDMSARHFLAELDERVTAFSRAHGRQRHLIAESDLNDPGILANREAGGYGMHAQWLDDFQHCVDAMLRSDHSPYRADFASPALFAKAMREGFAYSGEHCPSRGRRFGASSSSRRPDEFVAFVQNHDQVGNRPMGERFTELVDFEAYKLAAGAMLFSPYIPMLFMGEEYAEKNPFRFFADYYSNELARSVCEGRKQEFAIMHQGVEVPDPCARETFQASKLDWSRKEEGRHRIAFEYYRELIAIRRAHPSLRRPRRDGMEVGGSGKTFYVVRRSLELGETGETVCLMNFGDESAKASVPAIEGELELVSDSSNPRWDGPGSKAPRRCRAGDEIEIPAHALMLYRRI